MSGQNNDSSDEDSYVMVENCADYMFEGLDSNGQPLYQDSVPSTSHAVPSSTADWVNVEPHSGSSSSAMSLEIIETSSARPVEERPVLNDSTQTRPSSAHVVSLNDDLSGGELILTPHGQSTDQGDSQNASGQYYSGLRIPSQEAEIHPVSPDLFEQHPSLASVAYHDESPFPTPTNSQGSSADYPSLNEEARSLPSSQDSYSGMNPDSPAGSQPQSMFSLPMQFPSSQPSSDQEEPLSQNSDTAVPISSSNPIVQTLTELCPLFSPLPSNPL